MMKSPLKIKMIEDFEKFYWPNGYITTRDGNACARLDDGNFLVTASGVPKHRLDIHSFVTVDSNNTILETSYGQNSSIETLAHISAMKATGRNNSVHVHSPHTVALFALFNSKGRLADIENHIKTAWPEFFRYTQLGKTVPYLAPGSFSLHNSIESSFTADENNDIIVLERHGVFSVGNTFEFCRENIERLEHVSAMVLKILNANGGSTEGII